MKKYLQITSILFFAAIFHTNSQNVLTNFRAMQQMPNANFYSITHLLDSVYTANPDTDEDGSYMSYQRWKWYYSDRVNFGTDSLHGSFKWIDKFSLNAMYNPPCINQGSHYSYWNFSGPANNVAQQRGIVTAVAATHGLDTIFAGGRGTGLFRSLDFGVSWTNVTDYLKIPNLGIMDIAIDPKNSNTIYLATGNNSAYGVGLLKSINGGNTWIATGISFTPNQLISTKKVLVNPTYNNVVYALTDDTIYKSWDYGSNFTAMYGGIKNTNPNFIVWVDRTFNDMAIDYSDSSIIYAGTTGVHAGYLGNIVAGLAYMFKIQTGGGGITVTPLAIADSADKVVLATSPACPNKVMRFVFQLAGTPTYKLEKTYNKGQTWTQVSTANPADFDYYKNHILISKVDSNVMYAGGISQVGKSLNGGVNFSSPMVLHADKRKLFFLNGTIGSLGDTVLVGTDGGLAVTFNGTSTWNDISEGMQLAEFHGFDLSPTADESLSGGCQDIGYKSLFNRNWKIVTGVGDGYETVYLKRRPNYIFGYNGLFSSSMSRSSNNGNSFSYVTSISPVSQILVAPLFVDKHDSLFTARHELYRSVTPNLSWTKFSDFNSFSATTCLPTNKPIRKFSISPNNPSIIFVAFDGSSTNINPCTGIPWSTPRKNVFYRSENGGLTWMDLTNVLSQTEWDNITSIVTDQNNHQKVWVSFSGFDAVGQNHVFISTDGGNVFSDYSQGLPEFPVNCLIQQNNSGKCALYAGTDAGVFYRDSTMNAWECFNNNMPRTNVTDLAIDYCLGRVYAATYSRGIWYSNLAVVSNGNANVQTPIIIGDSFACKSSGVYSISNPQSGIFYSWTASNNQNGTGSTATLNLDAYAHTTLTFYAIDTTVWSACNSSVATFEIIACCDADSGRDWSHRTASWLKTQKQNGNPFYQYLSVGNPNVILGNVSNTGTYQFAINDSFIVDIPLKISQANVVLGPNAKIIVNPGIKLEVTGSSHFHTCNSEYMWDGIYLMDSAKLDASDKSIFEESINAAVTFGKARITILDSVYFLRNYIHIKMNPCTVNNTSSIRQTWFDCNDSSGTVTSLIKPFEGKYTYACILLDSVKNITIGDSSNSNATNYFKNAQFGIEAATSQVNVYNNNFNTIAGNLMSNIYYKSYAIHVNGDTVSRKVNIGSYNNIGSNYFFNCDNGILLQNKTSGKIENNYFNRTTYYGVSVYNPGNFGLTITRNTLSGFLTGIVAYDFYKAGANITSNTLRAGDINNFTSFNATCIVANNTGSKGNANLIIDLNNIDSSRVGIYVLNAKKPRIRFNNIKFRTNADMLSGNQFTGIYLGGCNGDSIMQNTIINLGSNLNQPSNFEDLHRAINIQNSPNSYIYSNYLTKFGTGIYFYSANQNGKLVCNTVINTHRGVHLDGANIGQQGSANNPWDNIWAQSPSVILRVSSVNTPLIPWYFQGVELNINNTLSPNPYTPNSVFPYELQTGPNLCLVDSNQKDREISDYLDSIYYPEYSSENYLYDLMYVYDRLRADSASRNANVDWDFFFNEWNNTEIGEFARVDELLDQDLYTEAISLLNTITPQNQIEELLKRAYLFYLNEYKSPIELTSDQQENLSHIIYGLPKEYGDAIYRLRAAAFAEIYDYPGTGRWANPSHLNSSIKDFISPPYPNPTSDLVAFNLHLSTLTEFTISDVYGKVLLRQKINSDVNSVNLNLKQFETGVYFITFKQNNVIFSNAKVVLFK